MKESLWKLLYFLSHYIIIEIFLKKMKKKTMLNILLKTVIWEFGLYFTWIHIYLIRIRRWTRICISFLMGGPNGTALHRSKKQRIRCRIWRRGGHWRNSHAERSRCRQAEGGDTIVLLSLEFDGDGRPTLRPLNYLPTFIPSRQTTSRRRALTSRRWWCMRVKAWAPRGLRKPMPA